MRIVNGTSIPESNLSKKYLGICYHAVREAYASGIRKVGFVEGTQTIENCLTKIIPGMAKEKYFEKWMWLK